MSDRCQHCGKPLDQAKTGRPRKFCSEACRAKARRKSGRLAALAKRVTGRPETPRPETPRPGTPRPTEARERELARSKGSPARAAALGRAMAKVARCEQELAAAKAARAALERPPWERDPLDQPHEYRTFTTVEEMRAGGAALSPPLDTAAVAEAWRQQAEREQG